MQQRVMSGIVGVPLFLALCFSPLWLFAVGVSLLAALGVREWIAAYDEPDPEPPAPSPAEATLNSEAGEFVFSRRRFNHLVAWAGTLLPLFALGMTQKFNALLPFFVGLGVAVVLAFSLLTRRAAKLGRALGWLRAYYGVVGYFYIGSLASLWVALRGTPGRLTVTPFPALDRGAWLFVLAVVCVWATDTCAYFVGKALGRRKLAPTLSPGKTVEGSLGGLLGALAVGAGFAAWIGLSPQIGLLVGGAAGVLGQIGDLFESALKRELGLKDFGATLPGHGGILDRFDSLLFVVPPVYLALRWLL